VKQVLPIALGAGALVSLFLFARRARSAPAPTPPLSTYGETERVAQLVPVGWRRVSSAEVATVPDLVVRANALRRTPGFASMPYGTLSPFVASNKRIYATWIEQHYHPPEGPIRPWGYHRGVTILAKR